MTLAPFNGRAPAPSILLGTVESQEVSCDASSEAEAVYHEPAWVAGRVVIVSCCTTAP